MYGTTRSGWVASGTDMLIEQSIDQCWSALAQDTMWTPLELH